MRKVKTPLAGPDYAPTSLPALPLSGKVTALPVTTSPSEIALTADTTAVQIYVDVDTYIAVDADASAGSWLLKGASYSTYGVDPSSILSVRAVTGAGVVRVLEA
jgi:hypothetical protein